MRFLLVSIFIISLMGILLIPNAFGVQYPVIIHIGVADNREMNFLPSVIEIEKGDTIIWKNLDRATYHTVTSASGLFDERLINCTYFEGGVGICGSQQSRPWKPTFSYTFEEIGTYDYNCKLHSWMNGVVKVIELGWDAELAVHGDAGDMYIDKSQYEVIEDGSVKIKIYGEVKNPGLSAYILFTVTKPDGSTSELKTYRTSEGYYQLILSINYEDRGTYNVVSTYGLENIGTANFVVVERSIPENLFSPSDDETLPLIQPPVSGNNRASNDLTVMTDFPSYKKGDMITISGMVPLDEWHASDFGDQGTSGHVIIRIFDPRNNMVTVSQFFPNDDTTYYVSFNGEGPMWKFEGDYTVKANFADSNAETKFAFTIPGTAFDSPAMESQAPSSSKTSTLLILDSIPSTFEAQGQNSQAEVIVSGKLTSSDRQYVITSAKIQLKAETRGTVTLTTDGNGEFSYKSNWGVGNDYGVYAVFDGTSNFGPSKSQTEYFDVRAGAFQPQTTAPTEDSSPAGGVALLVIIMIVVIVAIAIKKRKKKIPVTIPPPSGRGTAGTATIGKASKPRKPFIPRGGRAPLLRQQIRKAKRAVGRQSPKTKKRKDVMHYLRCKQCHLEEFLENEADGQQYCTKCGWKKQ